MRTIGIALVGSLIALVSVPNNAAAHSFNYDCRIQLWNYASLDRLPHDAASYTDAEFPYYYESCGSKTVYFIPYGGQTHYHLGFDDSSIGECVVFDPFAYGRLVNGTCVRDDDYAGENRYLTPHDEDDVISFYPSSGDFELGHMWIKGTKPAKVRYLKNGAWWVYSSLDPGYYNFSGAGRVSQFTVQTADGYDGAPAVDWFEIQD